jgi:hypothetical protein
MSICGDLIDLPQERKSATCKSPSSREKKPRQDRSKGNITLELFLDSSTVDHMEFVPDGATVNKHCFREILRLLNKSIPCDRPEV